MMVMQVYRTCEVQTSQLNPNEMRGLFKTLKATGLFDVIIINDIEMSEAEQTWEDVWSKFDDNKGT